MQRPEGEIEKGLLGYEGREGVIRTILTKFRVQDEVNKDTTNRMKYKRSMFWIRNYFFLRTRSGSGFGFGLVLKGHLNAQLNLCLFSKKSPSIPVD